MKKQFGLTRKLLRVGKNIEHFKAAAIALDSKPGVAGAPGSDPVLKYLAVGRQLGYGVYLSFDMLTYLDAAGIRKFAAVKKLQAHAQKAWLTGLLCSAIAGIYSMWRLSEMEKKINKKDGEGAVEGKKIQRFVLISFPQFSVSRRSLTADAGSVLPSQHNSFPIYATLPFHSLVLDMSTWMMAFLVLREL